MSYLEAHINDKNDVCIETYEHNYSFKKFNHISLFTDLNYLFPAKTSFRLPHEQKNDEEYKQLFSRLEEMHASRQSTSSYLLVHHKPNVLRSDYHAFFKVEVSHY